MRDAVYGESALLTRIVRESGAYHGPYRYLVEDQTIDSAYPFRSHTRVALSEGQVAGFYSITADTHGRAELDFMFVHDRWRKGGVGRAMFADLDEYLAALDPPTVRIVAHPPSEAFYLKMGAVRVDTAAPTGLVTWYRPVLKYGTRAVAAPRTAAPVRG